MRVRKAFHKVVAGSLAAPAAVAATRTGAERAAATPIYQDPSYSYARRTVANDTFTIGFTQSIGASDPLRARSASKTPIFTLSTTTP